MKALFVMTVFVTIAIGFVAPAPAQTPNIGVFFDKGWSRMDWDCPGAGIMDTIYVVARNFDRYLMAVEYAINYPPAMNWYYDLDAPELTIGTTPTGITSGFPTPQNGYFPLCVAKAVFMWTCSGCALLTDMPVVVSAHPGTGFLGAVDYPNYDLVPAVGMTSLVCTTVPTESVTWGKIKSLYNE
jgi:hypothetical protein